MGGKPVSLAVGELAARSGVAVSALHFYETKGLIHSERNAGNQRRYTRETLRRVAFIRAAQKVGLELDAIADALTRLPDQRTPTKADWTRLSRHWRELLTQRVEQLIRLRDTLDGGIGCGCLSLTACRLYNPDDELAKHGPGARRLQPQKPG
jgi:MerR family redox-sensitive transcriptional activator SoxR